VTVLPERVEPRPLSGTAVLAGALVGYGAFSVLISVVAAFANGAHANQALSAATWKQLGTGGGIVTAVVLFLSWAAGGYIAARLAGHDGLRHGVWTFVVGVVLMTVVAAAITWMPDTETIMRNLRLLGIPVRRAEWRDVLSVAGIGSLVGMALGAALGGRYGTREPVRVPARVTVPAAAPVAEPVSVEPSALPVEDGEPEPLFVNDAAPERAGEPVGQPSAFGGAAPEPDLDAAPAWWSPDPADEPTAPAQTEPEPVQYNEPAPEPAREPEPVQYTEPAPAPVEPEPVQAAPTPGSWWPDAGSTPVTEPAPQRAEDDAWALPNDQPTHSADDTEFAFPPAQPAPVGAIENGPAIETGPAIESDPAIGTGPAFQPDEVIEAQESPAEGDATPEPAPLAEHANWPHDRGAFQTPPEPGDDEVLQHEPATLFDEDESPEEATRRRQREDAARAYRRIIDDK